MYDFITFGFGFCSILCLHDGSCRVEAILAKNCNFSSLGEVLLNEVVYTLSISLYIIYIYIWCRVPC